MNPLRWDVLLVGFVLALPVLALWIRGDFTTEETVNRLPWCLAAGWGVVAVLRAVATPARPSPGATRRPGVRPTAPAGAADEDAPPA